jgi:hypothetical protein
LYGDSAGTIKTLEMQQGAGADPQVWGPEFGFARTMAATGATSVLIVKASRGGGGNTLWEKSIFDNNNSSGHMWGHLRDTVDTALTAAEAAGHQVRLRGLMYIQGESNGSSEASLADQRLGGLAANLQQYVNTNFANAAADMRTVIGEIAASSSNADRRTTTTRQRALADQRADVSFVQTHDLPLKIDGIHFGRDAKLAIGQRLAHAFIDLQSRSESIISRYTADLALPTSVPHPSTQGWTEFGAASQVTLQGTTEGETRGWQIVDNSTGGNSGYYQPLLANDYQSMFDQGWKFRAKVKAVSGSGTAAWTVSNGSAPAGWNIGGGTGNLIGVEVRRVNGDEFQVRLWQNQGAATINLGPNSANEFHTLELAGRAGSSEFELLVDGVVRSSSNLLASPGGPGVENRVLFQSGNGVGQSIIWNEVSLQAIPEPASLAMVLAAALIASPRQRRRKS